jgi:hypothetical protein
MMVKVPGLALTVSFVSALGGLGWDRGPGGVWPGIGPARDAVFALACRGDVGVDVERDAADDLEHEQVDVHRVGVAGKVDEVPVLDRADAWCLGGGSVVEADAVEREFPTVGVDANLVESDEAAPMSRWGGQPSRAAPE